MKQNALLFLAVLGFQLVFISPIQAQKNTAPDAAKSLEKALVQNRYSINLEGDKPEGEGWKWLTKKAESADIITLGESHGTKEIPNVMGALIKNLKASGNFDRLAIEVSPWTANLMEKRLRNDLDSYKNFLSRYSAAVPFYNWESEGDLLSEAIKGREEEDVLIGMDQIFSFSTDLVFDRLKTLAKKDSIFQEIENIRQHLEKKMEENPKLKALPAAVPPPITMIKVETLNKLKSRFEGNDRAQNLLDEVEKSIEIYRMNDTNNYQSNQIRAQLLRRNLRKGLTKSGELEGVFGLVIKTGAMHAYKGRTPNNALDVGNLAVSLADLTDGKALNVAVICGPGSKGRVFPAGTSPCWPKFLGETLRDISSQEPALFNLAPVHKKMHSGEIKASGALKEFLWGFDAVMIIPNANPTSYLFPLRQ